jgi:hypothetical protein
MVALVIAAACASELVARFALGLGDPPLHVAYPDLEYAFRPGTYRRFGNSIRINSHHMRSEEFPVGKTRPDEIRVLLMGDSVVNGGSLTDQSELASEKLQLDLAARLDRPVVVGNVSAGSWGPGNLLAYARRFGLFDADVVVVVLNSRDAGDNPTNQPIVGTDPSFPDRAPWSALAEAVRRYALPTIMPRSVTAKPLTEHDDAAAIACSMRDLGSLCDVIQSSGARVVLAHFPNRTELTGPMLPGHDAIAAFAAAKGIPLVEAAPRLASAIDDGTDPYRPADTIHPNAAGQRIMAAALMPEILQQLDMQTSD